MTRAKLVKGKVTLVARSLWPHLAALGASRGSWQLDGLSSDAADLLTEVDRAASPMRTPKGATKAVGVLERRLLIQTEQAHTETGRHAKVLQTWGSWARQEDVAADGIPTDEAMAAFERAVGSWPAIRGRLLPWR